MSVRAYRILNIERAEAASFNLWHDRAVMDWLEDNTEFFNRLNSDASGITEVSVQALKDMLIELGAELDPAIAAAIKDDIAWAEAHREEWIEYDCY